MYLSAADESYASRTWQTVIDSMMRMRKGPDLHRWRSVAKDKALEFLWSRPLIEANAEDLLRALDEGTVSTNVFLRRMHNYALDMNWLPLPIIPRKRWPKIKHQDKRAITLDEHTRIIERELNPERKAFYQLAWHLGTSQTDLANLQAEDIDWTDKIILFRRKKTGSISQLTFGEEVEKILMDRPHTGPLFPCLITVREADRATEFRQRCQGLQIKGITLHCYRYAWAERAQIAGYPERFAQVALGHNSKAVHRAYAKRALVKLPALEEYEKALLERKVIPMPVAVA